MDQRRSSGYTDEGLVNRVTTIVTDGQVSVLQAIRELHTTVDTRFDYLLRELENLISVTDKRFEVYDRELARLQDDVSELRRYVQQLPGHQREAYLNLIIEIAKHVGLEIPDELDTRGS